jgi:TRAP-type C4-dicarboxylate transport system permease small subunit
MAAPYDPTDQIIITEDAARGGVIGHNVRYVLAFGMTGVIAVFAAIVVWAGYDELQARLSASLAANPSDVVKALAPYAALVLIGAIGMGLMLGLWNLIAGRSEDDTESFFRARVTGQFILVCLIMTIFYMSGG